MTVTELIAELQRLVDENSERGAFLVTDREGSLIDWAYVDDDTVSIEPSPLPE